jgi:WD40 repeat protein
MKNNIFILFLFLLWPLTGNAQQEGNVWVFGQGGGLDFTTGVPVAFQSAIGHIEGCASIANADGQLLFYTDGDRIYNRNHQIMPNGVLFYGLPYPLWGAGPIYSSTQSSLILPVPGDSLKYYVFSLASSAFGYLWYSIVDMSLDNGLGNVVANKKNIMLNNGPLTEKMTAVRGNNCNVWLMVHNQTTNNYLAFEINASGINTTPVSSPAIAPTSAVGCIKFSHDRQRMAAASYGDNNGLQQALSLYAFDASTGILNFELQLDTAGPYYSACFSPDNSKLYATKYGGSLSQFDLSQPTHAAIILSKTLLGTSANGDLKLAPDGKIYFSNAGSTFIGSINQPNLPGIASAVVANTIALVPGTMAYYGLPNEIVIVKDTTTSRAYDLLVCFRDSILLQGNSSGLHPIALFFSQELIC